MSVIATDGIVVAGDTLLTFGHEKSLRPSPKIARKDDFIYAATGISILPVLMDWHRSGADPHKMPVVGSNEHWSLLVIDRDGMRLYSSFVPYPLPVDCPFAIGSGAEFALGAMDHGATPQEAVAIAIRRTNTCGGEIQVVNIAEALGLQRLEAAE